MTYFNENKIDQNKIWCDRNLNSRFKIKVRQQIKQHMREIKKQLPKDKKSFSQKLGNSVLAFFQIGRLGVVFFQCFYMPTPLQIDSLRQSIFLNNDTVTKIQQVSNVSYETETNCTSVNDTLTQVLRSSVYSEKNTPETNCTSVQDKAICSSVRDPNPNVRQPIPLKNQYQYVISAKKHVDHKTYQRRLIKTVLILVPVVSIGLPVYMHFSHSDIGLLKSFYAELQIRPNISSQLYSVTKQALHHFINFDLTERNFKIRTLSENRNFFLSQIDNALSNIEQDMYDFYAYNYNYDFALMNITPREQKKLITRYIFTIWAGLWNQYLTMNEL